MGKDGDEEEIGWGKDGDEEEIGWGNIGGTGRNMGGRKIGGGGRYRARER